jgi:very-short-patch-repair endonuclease
MVTHGESPPPLRGRSVRAANREGGATPAHRPIAHINRFRAKSMRSEMTDAERVLWSQLRAHRLNGLSFRRQVPIGSFIVDFVCHEYRLIIELDGGQHASDREIRHDQMRQAWLNAKGYRVLRFWNSDVLRHRESVVETIIGTIMQSVPPSRSAKPTDLPLKGRGEASPSISS